MGAQSKKKKGTRLQRKHEGKGEARAKRLCSTHFHRGHFNLLRRLQARYF